MEIAYNMERRGQIGAKRAWYGKDGRKGTEECSENATLKEKGYTFMGFVKLTEELKANIIRMLEEGYLRESVFRSLGIGERNVQFWLKTVSFREAIEQAESKYYLALQKKLLPPLNDDSKAALEQAKWIAERRYSETFGSKQKLGLTAEVKPVRIVLKRFTVKDSARQSVGKRGRPGRKKKVDNVESYLASGQVEGEGDKE